ncbi:MAG: hypothetical protein LUC91_04745 [Prevotella sp.]|nr:hypothetical protein [Prevotella sp.]
MVNNKQYQDDDETIVKALDIKTRYEEDNVDIMATAKQTPLLHAPAQYAHSKPFPELPEYVYQNKKISVFLECFRSAIDNTCLFSYPFSRMYARKPSESEIEIEWVYDKIRLFFSFDEKDKDYYGINCYDSHKGSFYNMFQEMNPSKYQDYVTEIINGINEFMKKTYISG